MEVLRAPLTIGPARWDWSKTYIFGVVNVTPDSFSDGGHFLGADAAIAHGEALVAQGADAIDIGGESTRPGADPVPAAEELRRVLPVVRGLTKRVAVPVAIDTYKAQVAEAALGEGACIVNDISGMQLDSAMGAVVAREGATIVLGHLRGTPTTMHKTARMGDDLSDEAVIEEVIDDLRARVRAAIRAGIAGAQIWVDPGIGFGKNTRQSLALLRGMGRIVAEVGYPVMVGPSRKSFIGAVTGRRVADRLEGTCAAAAAVVIEGADAVRLHDVGELLPAIQVADAIRRRACPGDERGGPRR